MSDRRQALVLIALFAPGLAGAASNIDPAGDGHKYAWGENVGWINALPQGSSGPGAVVGDTGLTGWMWGENIGWINLSCSNEAHCDVTSYGVTNDGFGHLGGFAWGENVGWINFAPTACAGDPTCGVRVDPSTGYFSGRAWGENIGWITFASAGPQEWTTRTGWCQSTAAPPGAGITLTLQSSAKALLLTWTPIAAASWFDVVGGALSVLESSRGDFALATRQCFGSRVLTTTLAIAGPRVPPGDGAFFLVRASNCKGHGTYDEGSSSQVGNRDAGIAGSQRDCP